MRSPSRSCLELAAAAIARDQSAQDEWAGDNHAPRGVGFGRRYSKLIVGKNVEDHRIPHIQLSTRDWVGTCNVATPSWGVGNRHDLCL